MVFFKSTPTQKQGELSPQGDSLRAASVPANAGQKFFFVFLVCSSHVPQYIPISLPGTYPVAGGVI